MTDYANIFLTPSVIILDLTFFILQTSIMKSERTSITLFAHRTLCLLIGLIFVLPALAQDGQGWWKKLGNNRLDSLMQEAFIHNLDLQTAQDRILSARSAYRASLGAMAPQLSIQTGWIREKNSGHLSSRVTPSTFESYYSGLIKGSLTVDIFGQLRKASEVRRAAYRAQIVERETVMLTLSKEVAATYMNLCSTQWLIKVLSANIDRQQEIVQITQARYDAGLVSQLDVAQAQTTLSSTKADITQYKSQATAYVAQLAVLLATEPQALKQQLEGSNDLPDVQLLLPDSIPIEMLRLRPDLRQAEWLIDEAAAALGANRKEWLPTFLINGYIGLMSHHLNDLLHARSWSWQVEPVMQWTLFNGGQRVENIRQARYALQEQVNNYNLLMFTAMQQVETSAMAYEQSQHQVLALYETVKHAENSLLLSSDLYKMGLTSFINVVQAQQSVLQYQTSLVSARNNAVQNLITLLVALSPGSSSEE